MIQVLNEQIATLEVSLLGKMLADKDAITTGEAATASFQRG